MDRDSADALRALVRRAVAAAGRLGAAEARLADARRSAASRLDPARHDEPRERARQVDEAHEELTDALADISRALDLAVARAAMPTMRDVAVAIERIQRRRAGEAALALALGPTPTEAP